MLGDKKSMYPILIDWGFIYLPAWHTFYALGALASYLTLIWGAKTFENELFASKQLSTEILGPLFTLCYLAGYFGARLLSILIEEPARKSVWEILSGLLTLGPMTFYGGALASGLVGWIFLSIKKVPIGITLDLAIPSGLIGLSFGRIGCFLNGDDYGKAAFFGSGSPPFWAVKFPALGDGIYRWPVQLMESAAVLLVVMTLFAKYRSLRQNFRPGIVAYLGIVLYANIRMADEFLRDDFRGFVFGTYLSTSQFISLIILAMALMLSPFFLKSNRFE